MKTLIKLMAVTAVALALAGGRAKAQTTNYWKSDGISYGGDWTNTAHWSLGTVPAATQLVAFTNRQSGAYTVKFTQSQSSGALQVLDDSATYDVNGYNWTLDPTYASYVLTNTTVSYSVKFSSSSPTNVANGNVVNFGVWPYTYPTMGGGTVANPNAKVTVDDSLGNPVKVIWQGAIGFITADVTVSGPGSEFQNAWPNVYGGFNGNTLVTNGAVISGNVGPLDIGRDNAGGVATTRVVNAKVISPGGTEVGSYYGTAILDLRNGSTWNDGGTIAVSDYLGTWYGGASKVLLDNSTLVGQKLQIGDPSTSSGSGQFHVLNGSSATFSNSVLVSATWSAAVTNLLVLNNGTIALGGGAVAGVLTNRGVMRAAGTIRGQGASPALVLTEAGGTFEVGSSIGTLTLSNANLNLAAGSKSVWEFSDTGLDQVVDHRGFVHLLGTNLFSLAAGAPAPTNGVKYGLGVYDFVIATNNNISTPQYDSLVNLLTNTYHLVYGVDFQYGVVNLGGGLFALELAFVPEPSTVLLLALGGLLVWRRSVKKSRK